MGRIAGIGDVYTYDYKQKHPKTRNVGFGYYDPNKVFTKPDKNGEVKVDDVLSTICKEDEAPKDYVIIGGKKYKTVKIGSQTWLAENLEYLDDNIVLGTDCFYYNNDQQDSYGLLYIGSSISKLDSIVEGWHVPTQEDFEELITFAGGSNLAGGKLKSKSSWTDRNGTDDYGFDGKANGLKIGSGFDYKGSRGIFWTKTVNDSQNFRFGLQDSGDVVIANFLSNTIGASVRLIKDS